MIIRFKFVFTLFLVSHIFLAGNAQNEWTTAQREVIQTINGLSETTAPNGKGANAYGTFLADDFSRWTVGDSEISYKENWIEGIKKWFTEGWRVSERKQQFLEITILDNIAHTRRLVTEKYRGPKGELSSSKAALAEIWTRKDGKWLLYRVNVHPIPKK